MHVRMLLDKVLNAFRLVRREVVGNHVPSLQSPGRSRPCSARADAVESACLRHTRATVMWLMPTRSASLRVLQWVAPSGGCARRELQKARLPAGVSTLAA
jgi:hypothetical protein